MCATEQKNAQNAPEAFYTPNRNYCNYMISTGIGNNQEIPEGLILFDMDYLSTYELTKSINNYYPMIISVNYQDNNEAQFAMMTYCTFTKDGQNEINGVHVSK